MSSIEPIITFKKDNHIYTTRCGTKLTSVNGLIKKYEPVFERDYWLMHGAIERQLPEWKTLRKEIFGHWKPNSEEIFQELNADIDIQLLHKDIVAIAQDWEEERVRASTQGTEFHDMMETVSYERGFEVNPWTDDKFDTMFFIKEYDNQTLMDDLYQLPDGFYPELLVYWGPICGQADKVFIETVGDTRYIDIDDYKGLALDTPILTTLGWKVMGDITTEDVIYDGLGKPTTITAVSEVHHNPCYSIKFDTNDVLVSDHEHKWVVSLRDRYKGYYDIEVTTDELFRMHSEGTILRIRCASIDEVDSELPIDPYVLGLWLADGNRTCGTLTCENYKIWEEISRRGYSISENHNDNLDKAESRTIYGIRGHLVDLGILGNKNIPSVYLTASFSQRLDLLRGLMDGDGHFNKTRKRCIMATTSHNQALYTSSLVSSLGFKPTIINATHSGFGKTGIGAYHVCFSPDVSPFLVRNTEYEDTIVKVQERSKVIKSYRYITSIEKIDTVPTKCIAVSSDDKTYLAGFNLIKTHNTNKKIKRSAFSTMKDPLGHIYANHVTKYNLAISMYAFILEKWGFSVRNLAFTHYKDYDPSTAKMYPLEYLKDEITSIYPKASRPDEFILKYGKFAFRRGSKLKQ